MKYRILEKDNKFYPQYYSSARQEYDYFMRSRASDVSFKKKDDAIRYLDEVEQINKEIIHEYPIVGDKRPTILPNPPKFRTIYGRLVLI